MIAKGRLITEGSRTVSPESQDTKGCLIVPGSAVGYESSIANGCVVIERWLVMTRESPITIEGRVASRTPFTPEAGITEGRFITEHPLATSLESQGIVESPVVPGAVPAAESQVTE
ncbi:hypothetical protein AB0O34_23265 [Sphaerisporangium sp. NPDC088356]|uniref:hypothetical protein n=1 Tax=Sphaerisporangium sp. NPDC088356 TaxID=3154871 RepID=UPI0034413548